MEAPRLQAMDTAVARRPDHRWTGLAIGAVTLGAGMAFLGSRLCERHEDCTGTTIGFGLIGATAGAVVGGLIGSAIPKDGPE